MMNAMQQTDEFKVLPIARPPRFGRCPSCGAPTTFTFAGEQHLPERVARAADLPLIINLWQCGHCHTTLGEMSVTFRAD